MTSQPLASVLVVDDDPVMCEVAASYFRKSGASQIAIAHSGKDALEIVERLNDAIDFILLDLKMPEMDGVQFLRHMQDRAFQGMIGIISGEGAAILTLAIELAKKHALNVVGPFAKPLDPAELDAVLSSHGASDRSVPRGHSVTTTFGELEEALHRRQIATHYQPQIDATTGAIRGVEALARWHHPERGLISPAIFVPMAEDSGLMPLLTERVIENVVSHVETLDRVCPGLTVSINLGAAVLSDTAFPDAIVTMVDQCGIDRNRFILELTESKLVQDSADPMEVLARLDLSGFELSLDDFGTQFSNIEQLTKFPFRELKIDRSFVGSMTTDDRSKATVESCLSLGKRLGMRVVAEGVETNEDWEILANLGVDIIQGFLIAKPMPIDEHVSWATCYRSKDCRDQITVCT